MSTKYTVKKGDTLSKIAKQYNTTVAKIQKANAKIIKDVNKIKIGMVLDIPTPTKNKYNELLNAVEKCVKKVEKLKEFKKVCELLNDK